MSTLIANGIVRTRDERTKMINLQNTGKATADAIKLLVYGAAGVGKTSLIPTMPKPIILSAEAGLLALLVLICRF